MLAFSIRLFYDIIARQEQQKKRSLQRGGSASVKAMEGIIYELSSPVSSIFEDTEVTCYGIKCIKDGVELMDFKDILPDKKRVEELIELCNSLDLAPEHLPDILEDFLP